MESNSGATMFGQEIRLILIRQSILDRLSRTRWKQKWLNNAALQRYSVETLKKNLTEVLESLEDKTDLFEDLLCSYPARLKAVREARGQHTHF